MRIKAIINPVSGPDKARSEAVEMTHRLRDLHMLRSDDIYYTTPGNADLRREFFKDCDMLAVAGGDGTLHHMINRLKRYGLDIPIAYLPNGTTNDFGSTLRLPRTAEDFCDMLADPVVQSIDLGRAGERYFHYVVSGGALSSVSYTTNQGMKNLLGQTAYYLSVLPQLNQLLKGVPIRIESDEVSAEIEALTYFVAHSPTVAGFPQMIPGARADDGLLHVLVLKKTNPLGTASLFRDILRGEHIGREDVLYFKTRRVCVTPEDSGAAQISIDGEPLGGALQSIEVIPGGQAIIVPRRQLAVA